MNKPRRKSDNKSRRSSGRSVISNSGQSGKDQDVNKTATVAAKSPSGIPTSKWREITSDAEQDFVVNSVREDLIRDAMDTIYARYLKKKSYAFVVDCSHLAWIRLFDLIDLKHDPGENAQTIAESWSYDKPPDPVPTDPWSCRRMTVLKEDPAPQEPEPCKAECSAPIDIKPKTSIPSFKWPPPKVRRSKESVNNESSNHDLVESKSDIINGDKSSSSNLLTAETSLTSLSQSQRSIFTRTISMVKTDLPMRSWQSHQEFINDVRSTREKKTGFRSLPIPVPVQPPEQLDLGTLPADNQISRLFDPIREAQGAAATVTASVAASS